MARFSYYGDSDLEPEVDDFDGGSENFTPFVDYSPIAQASASVDYPATLWDYYEDGEFPAQESVPVNRRNPRSSRRRAAPASRVRSAKQIEAGKRFGALAKRAWAIMAQKGCSFRTAFQEARGEQRAAANPVGNGYPYWPYDEYEQIAGPYGSDIVPPNRRNPRAYRNAGDVKTLRFGKCCRCGESLAGQRGYDTGEFGPHGGRQFAHENCSR